MQEAFLQAIIPAQHSKRIPDRLDGTCQWLFEKDEYHAWRDGPQPQVLVIAAGTGWGKSVLARYLTSKFKEDVLDAVVLSFFCKDDSTDQKSALTVVRNLLYQLLSEQRHLLRLIPHHALVAGGQASSNFQLLWDTFVSILQQARFEHLYCIIDGLDECDSSLGILTKSLENDFLTPNQSGNTPMARIVITTQLTPEVITLAESNGTVFLEIQPEDVNPDIFKLVSQEISKIGSRRIGSQTIVSPKVAEAVGAILKDRADGMFQWAELVLDDLKAPNRSHSDHSIQELFQTVPETLAGLYDRAFKKIRNEDRGVAEKILQVLLFASGPLTEQELAFAYLGDDSQYQAYDQIKGYLEPSMARLAKSVCGSFLKSTDQNRLLAVSHQSARSFLLKLQDTDSAASGRLLFDSDDGQLMLARKCLHYLLLRDVQADSEHKDEQILYAQYPFLQYAERNWSFHLRRVKDLSTIEDLVRAFFDIGRPKARAWAAAWPDWVQNFPDRGIHDDRAILHLLVACGLLNILYRCSFLKPSPGIRVMISNLESPLLELNASIDAAGSDDRTPLMIAAAAEFWDIAHFLISFDANESLVDNRGVSLAHLAATAGDTSFLQHLRQNGNDLSLPDVFGQTPLHLAILAGQKNATSFLLEQDSKSNNISGVTPLHLAAQVGEIDLVRELLRTEADVDRPTKSGLTCLMLAVSNQHQEIVELLLENDAQPDLADEYGLVPLHFAAENEDLRSLKILLDQGANPDVRDNFGNTPLMVAARQGNLNIVTELLLRGVKTDCRDDDGNTALHTAVDGQHYTVVDLLLRHNPKINLRNESGFSVLHLAAAGGNEAIVKLILSQADVVVDQPSNVDRYPLWSAAKSGFDKVVELLLCHHADPEGVKTSQSQVGEPITALQIAADSGKLDVVRRLVSAGANLEAEWRGAFTPLFVAAKENHPDVVDFLLTAGANPLCRDKSIDRSPQHYLARDGHRDLLLRILDAGGDAMWTDEYGITPLHYACRGGSESIVQLLLQRGFNPKAQSQYGWTPLHEAAQNGHKEVCKHLLAWGADINHSSSGCPSPLMSALSECHEAVARMLLEEKATIENSDERGITALHIAADKGMAGIVRLMLQSSINIDIATKQRVTPLMFSARKGHKAVARVLIDSGADVSLTDIDGITTVHYAAESGSEAVLKMLLDKKAPLNSQDIWGRTALIVAAGNGKDKALQNLLNRGAEVNTRDNCYRSALHWAAFKCQAGNVKSLINAGADIAAADSDLHTPLYWATERIEDEQSSAIIKMLLESGAKPNSLDIWGDSSLIHAASLYRRSAVNLLVAAGGDIGMVDSFGRTAYYWAQRPFNHNLPSGSDARPPNEPQESVRVEIVERTIRRLIVQLRKTPEWSSSRLYRFLGKCLQFQNDQKNSVIAYEQRRIRKKEEIEYNAVCSSPSHPAYPAENMKSCYYVCSSCPHIELCETCFGSGASYCNGCSPAHLFTLVPRQEAREFPDGMVDGNGTTVYSWLCSLRDSADEETDGLQIWTSTAWTSLISCRQIWTRVWIPSRSDIVSNPYS